MKRLLLFLVGISCGQLFSQPFHDFHTIANIPGSNPVEIQLADMDSDNDPDVFVAYAGISELAWFENLGSNNFSTKKTIASSVAPLRLILKDVDADGLPDVLYSSSNNKVGWFQNLGNGSFSNELVIDNSIMAPIVIQSGDVDGDGVEDLLVVSDTSNEINWYKNLGSGNWGPKALLTNLDTRYLAVGDLDHDNDLDLLAEDGPNVVWLENVGAGNFGVPVDLYPNLSQIGGVYTADITSDGYLDPVVLFDGKIGYRKSLGNGYFAYSKQTVTTLDLHLFALEDIDGDGNLNALIANGLTNGTDEIYNMDIINNEYFVGGSIITNKPQVNDFKIGDVDNDGDFEVFSCGSDQVIWLENLKPVDNDNDGYTFPADCNDFNADVYPGAPEICDGLDNNCDGILNEPGPDLQVQLFAVPTTIVGFSKLEMAIRITNTSNFPTDGTQIRIRMLNNPRFVFVWNIGLQMAANRNVDNSNWNYLGDNGLSHEFSYNGPQLIIPAQSSLTFGLSGYFDPQGKNDVSEFTAQILPFSGGECNFSNNDDSVTIVYFQ